ncbi:uncharacterized protein DNG_08704 [Cephalotrichum gorgonifer]|uniref:Uncharacterized protein n=1 Tax=Cephalotrichum gorgonifer TaxID=2041049 RepID=A0AAE8SYL9_9PEZI|nr:uncharacterized protein DNG_08704 [Cephalotrichum gorgonifer]
MSSVLVLQRPPPASFKYEKKARSMNEHESKFGHERDATGA